MWDSFGQRVTPKDLQRYFEALACDDRRTAVRKRKLLEEFAELQFKLKGGSHCAVCRAAVRHVVPVYIEDHDGATREFPCLCIRCLAGESLRRKRVLLRLGSIALGFGDLKRSHRKFTLEALGQAAFAFD